MRVPHLTDRTGALACLVLGAALAVPLGLRHDLPGTEDLSTHAALIESQFQAWRTLGRPSPYVAPLGGQEHFAPTPAIYGGAAYAVLGLARYVAPLPLVLVLAVAVGWAATAWGLYRIARAVRCPPATALAIASATVASGQVVSTVYARMALLEVIGWGAVLAVAGAVALIAVEGARRRPGALVVIAGGTAATASHLLTATWAVVLAVSFSCAAWAVWRPALGPARRWAPVGAAGLVGVLATSWQWPVVAHVFGATTTDRPRDYLASGWFLAPLGTGSGPNLWRELDPFRPPVGSDALAAHRTTLPVLLAVWTIAVLVATRSDPARARTRRFAIVCLTVGIVLLALPRSPGLVDVLWPVATMQYHWRLLTYVAVAIAIAAIATAARRGQGHPHPTATRLLVALAVVEVVLGGVQAWGIGGPAVPSAGVGTAAGRAQQADPNPWVQSNRDLFRAADLPELPAQPSARVLAAGDSPEADVVLELEGGDRATAPVVAGPPVVDVAAPGRAVGWAPRTAPPTTDLQADANHLLLVVASDGADGTDTAERADVVRIAPASSGPLGWARATIGPATWALLLVVVGGAFASAARALRRPRTPVR